MYIHTYGCVQITNECTNNTFKTCIGELCAYFPYVNQIYDSEADNQLFNILYQLFWK